MLRYARAGSKSVGLILLLLLAVTLAGCTGSTGPGTLSPQELSGTDGPGNPLEGAPLWRMGRDTAFLAGAGVNSASVRTLQQRVGAGFYLGGSLQYVYDRLPIYRDDLRGLDTLLLLNISTEDVTKLAAWPQRDRSLLPAALEDLVRYEPPFAYLTRQGGRVRGIVVGRTMEEIERLLAVMVERSVPLGVPWTVKPAIFAAEPASKGWTRETMERGRFRASYIPGLEADAERMLAWAEDVLGKLRAHFPEVDEVVEEPVTLWLHGAGELQDGYAYAETPSATLHFTSPSAADSRYYDHTWYVGNIAHEYSHVFFDRMRRRAGAYGMDADSGGPPRWFHEGLGEYFRLLVIGEQTFDRIYGQRYGAPVGFLLESPLEAAEDVYAAGALALRFLDARVGVEGIRRILVSSQPTFWDAVHEATGLSRPEFDQAFRDWLRRNR
ncbi:MAG: hypothetical protein BAA04_10255 [Firmicutes bacterium ZCTH02-B6]|nr:MAG: hypothetical protein BAA04_10255 [Firmicutes bacterium ZCTH02-B6]